LWLVAGQRLTARLRRWWASLGGEQELGPALPLYLLYLTAVSALPLDMTLSPADLYHKYKEGRVQLVALVGGPDGLVARLQSYLANEVLFLPVGLLLAAWA